MPKKRHKPEEIVAKLCPVEVMVADEVRAIGVTEVTYYRLRRAVANLTLDKQILKQAASGSF